MNTLLCDELCVTRAALLGLSGETWLLGSNGPHTWIFNRANPSIIARFHSDSEFCLLILNRLRDGEKQCLTWTLPSGTSFPDFSCEMYDYLNSLAEQEERREAR